jgi:hypothetical protein
MKLPKYVVDELFEISTASNLEKDRLVSDLERQARGGK